MLARILFAIVTLPLVGCVTPQSEINQFYRPETPIKQKPVAPTLVRLEEVPFKPDKKRLLSIINQGYILLGIASFRGRIVSPDELRHFAGSVGGDLVLYEKKFRGIERGARMVLGSYTPPSVGYSTASASGYASGSAYSTAQTPWGPVSADSYGYGNSYGTATSTTFFPGQATYVRQEFDYEVYEQGVVVWQSPQGQVRNWVNIEKATGDGDAVFNLEEFLSTYRVEYKTMSPQRKALADAIESGQKFTQLTAKQFLFNQYMMNSQREFVSKMK